MAKIKNEVIIGNSNNIKNSNLGANLEEVSNVENIIKLGDSNTITSSNLGVNIGVVAIEELLGLITASSLNKEIKEEAIEILEAAIEESKKEKPKKFILKSAKELLKKLGKVATLSLPILKTIPKVLEILNGLLGEGTNG